MTNMTPEEIWATALQEVQTEGARQPGLWGRCFTAANGDEAKAKSAYLTQRVKELTQERDGTPQDTSRPELGMTSKAPKKTKWWLWIPLGLFAAFTLFGAMQPDDPAKDHARRTIALCRETVNDVLLSTSARLLARGACERMENEYETKYGRRP